MSEGKYKGLRLDDVGGILAHPHNICQTSNGEMLFFRCCDIGKIRSYGAWVPVHCVNITTDEQDAFYEKLTYALIDMDPELAKSIEMRS